MNSPRIENLDALRACAVLMVLVYHSTQTFSLALPVVWWFTKAGLFGVDLFFALSGFLIGSLFFQEKNTNGVVQIPRFILRRISRTVPPYFLALILSYLAVYLYREEAFDFGYLLFLQNYYQEMPFFFISWSLCVEEHFYLALPVFLTVLFKLFKRPSIIFIIILFLISLIPLYFRFEYQEIRPKAFGFYATATHLKYDPLILGVLFAYVSIYFQSAINCLLKYKTAIYLLSCLLLLSYSWWPREWMYSIGTYLLGATFAATVALACVDRSWSISKFKIVSIIAVASYAIYLTHVLTFHALEKVFALIGLSNVYLGLAMMMIFACFIGYTFYYVFERPLMAWRKKQIPSYRTVNSNKGNASAVS